MTQLPFSRHIPKAELVLFLTKKCVLRTTSSTCYYDITYHHWLASIYIGTLILEGFFFWSNSVVPIPFLATKLNAILAAAAACVRRGKAIPPQQGPQRQPERIYPIQIPHEYVRTQVRRYDEPRA